MNFLINLLSVFGGVGNSILGLISSTMQKGFQAAIQFHKEGIAFARDAGLSAKQAQAYTNTLIQRTEVLANRYGVSAEAIMQVQRGISEATGKQLLLNDAQAEGFVRINKLVGAQASARFQEEMMNGMGGQIDAVEGAISRTYSTAMKQGLNAKKLTDKVAQNLGMANRLSFRNGIDGLIRMTALSEKLGMNMQSVESAAGQFLELDKAIENAAQMQMLGGSAAANFGNPLLASYEANYDPEAFAQRLSDSLASYATFDASKGISSINGMNMDFVRNIAKAMGISTEEASKMAKKQAEVQYKENKLSPLLNSVAGGDEARRNYILNNAQVTNNGRDMEIQGKNIKDFTDKEWDEMIRIGNMSDEEIMKEQAMRLTSIDEQISGASASVAAGFADGLKEYMPGIQQKIKDLGDYMTGWSKQWGASTGQAVGKAMDWLNRNGPKIRTVADAILSKVSAVIDFLSKHWQGLIAAIAGWKLLLSPLLSGMLGGGGKGLAGAARSAARVSGGAIKSMWKAPLQVLKNVPKEGKLLFSTLRNDYRAARGFGMSRGASVREALNSVKVIGKAGRLSNLAKVAKSGGIGIAGALGNIAVDSAVASGKMKRGGVAHYGTKMAATAAEYAAFGSMLGPIGTGVGAAVGAIKGAYDTWKSLPENADKNFLDYAKSVGNSIVEGGKEAFNWAKEKVGPALSAVNKEIQDRGGYLSVAFKAITMPVRMFISSLEGIAKFIAHPVDTIKNIWNKLTNWLSGDNILGKLFNKAVNVIIGEKHAEGGFINNGAVGVETPTLAQKGEVILNPAQQKNFMNIANGKTVASAQNSEVILNPTQQKNFTAIANNESTVKAKPVGEKEYIYMPSSNNTNGSNVSEVTVRDINLNVSGTIKLDGGNGSKNVDINKLLEDTKFISSLKDLIKQSINNDINNGRFMNDMASMRGMPSQVTVWGRK